MVECLDCGNVFNFKETGGCCQECGAEGNLLVKYDQQDNSSDADYYND